MRSGVSSRPSKNPIIWPITLILTQIRWYAKKVGIIRIRIRGDRARISIALKN